MVKLITYEEEIMKDKVRGIMAAIVLILGAIAIFYAVQAPVTKISFF